MKTIKMLRLLARRASGQVHVHAAVSRGFATTDKVVDKVAGMPTGGAVKVPPLSKDGELDWDGMAALMDTDSTRRELQQLRMTYMDTDQRVQELAKDTPEIDWAHWKKALDPKLVASFETAYNSIEVPEYQDTSVEKASAAFEDLKKQASELAQHSKVRMAEIAEEMKALDNEKEKMTTLTADDIMEMEPDLKKKLHKEISEGKFFDV